MRIKGKLENYATVAKVEKEIIAGLPEDQAARKGEAKGILHELQEKVLREEILDRGVRLDGRKFDEIRPITIENTVLPRVHGSSVFTRGETQALVTVTLGTADDQQKIEMVDGETWKRFMLHYNFPPFSVGEVKPMRGPGRREIGHGALAERALDADDARRSRLRLHGAHRLGHPRVERQLVDGVGVRRLAGDDGRRRADQGRRSPAWRWASSWTRPPASTRC